MCFLKTFLLTTGRRFFIFMATPRIFRQSQTKVVGKVLYNLTVVHFNPEKREFSLLLNIPRPPYSMLGYNRTITRTNINVLINIGPGAGGGRKRTGKKGNLPNTFVDDCRYKMQTRNHGVSIKHGPSTDCVYKNSF